MLQPLDQMNFVPTVRTVPKTWAAIPAYLDAKIAAGTSRSSITKLRSAVNGLLKAVAMTPENARINLDWFDRVFPLDGWDSSSMSIEQATYRDYRNRVRRLLEEMLGVADEKKALRAVKDGWDDAVTSLAQVEGIEGVHCKKKLIPVRSTLTMAARRAGLQPSDLDQRALLWLYAEAEKGEKGSLRSASRLISMAQEKSADVACWFPNPISPIPAEGAFRYAVPEHLVSEVEHFVELAARKKFIRAKKLYEYVKDGTRIGMRTTMNAVVDALIATGHLDPSANSFAPALEQPAVLEDVLGHMARRVEDGEIRARHATTLAGRLPVMLERNGIEVGDLRKKIKEVEELAYYPKKAGMPEATKRFCRKLIENRKFRNRFLLAHVGPRLAAQKLLDNAALSGRELSGGDRLEIIRFGVVALFCAIEIGGAPVRVGNFLEMSYGSEDAWMRLSGNKVCVTIPGGHVKNRQEIKFDIARSKQQFAETIEWYIEHIRPLLLPEADSGEVESPWLIPMLSDPTRACPYETFHSWFTKIMRDVVGVRCMPHNYRHGQASLLYHNYPERIGWIAVRLGDTEETVVEHYAWVHAELAMAAGQHLITNMIEN